LESIEETMKAAYIERPGPAENILYGELPTPTPGPGQVLVRVKAVSVNPIDLYVRSGMVAMNLPITYIVGCDLAGVVDQVGPEVAKFKPGNRVWGSNQGLMGRQGTFAEYAAVDQQWLYPTPEGVDDKDAAAIALVGITAYLGTVRDARLQPGETLLVHGGSGGVGSCVVQMAKAIGARVITTAGSDDKMRLCRQLGADEVVNYKTQNVDEAIQRFAPGGVNVWFETLREQNLEQAISHLAKRGRLILMAGRDSRPPFPVGPFYTKDCSAHGFAMFNAPAEEQQSAAASINRWMAEGKLRPLIGRVMPLSEAAAAHRLQEENTLHQSGSLSGKIVLTP
jgi:NADPH2:quinone reductase